MNKYLIFNDITKKQEITKAFKAVEDFDLISENSWIAGGSIEDLLKGKRPKDLDVYFKDYFQYQLTLNKLEATPEFKFIGENQNTYKVSVKGQCIDLVKMFFDTPETCMSYFDFTVCCAALTHKGLLCLNSYFPDMLLSKVVFNKLQPNICVLERVQKYIKKGYSMDRDTIKALYDHLLSFKDKPDALNFSTLMSG